VGDIDDYLMRLSMGGRTEADMPQEISVMTLVDSVEKDVEGFRHQYDLLSPFHAEPTHTFMPKSSDK